MTWRLALRGVGVSAALSIAVACAQGEDGIDIGGGAGTDPDAGSEGGARLPTSDSGGGSSGTNPDPNDDGGTDPGCTGKVVINELMTTGPQGANDEFVELYNPNSCAISLAGWRLAYKPTAGTGGPPADLGSVYYTFAAGDSIAAGAFFVLGTASFVGSKDATMKNGMSADGGQVGLVDDTDTLVDALGWGGATGPYVEGTAAPKAPTNGSVGRKSDGLDTDNNASDCKAFNKPTPGAANN